MFLLLNSFSTLQSEFGEHEETLKSRCFFITTHSTPSEATPPTTIPNPTTLTEELEITVATAMAWDREIDGKPTGSLHWVCVHPEFQGMGFSKVIVGALTKLFEVGWKQVTLSSQTQSIRAIQLYLKLGFKPMLLQQKSQPPEETDWVTASKTDPGWAIVWNHLRPSSKYIHNTKTILTTINDYH